MYDQPAVMQATEVWQEAEKRPTAPHHDGKAQPKIVAKAF